MREPLGQQTANTNYNNLFRPPGAPAGPAAVGGSQGRPVRPPQPTVAQLQEMARRQQAQIEAQQQLLVAKEQRLKYLRQQDYRHHQMAAEYERLRRLREKVRNVTVISQASTSLLFLCGQRRKFCVTHRGDQFS